MRDNILTVSAVSILNPTIMLSDADTLKGEYPYLDITWYRNFDHYKNCKKLSNV
jgi:hypothetical protein